MPSNWQHIHPLHNIENDNDNCHMIDRQTTVNHLFLPEDKLHLMFLVGTNV